MSFVLTLILLQLYAMCISAMVIPITNPINNRLWDLERGLDFHTFYESAIKDSKPEIIEVKNTSAKSAKREQAARRAKTKPRPAIADLPQGGVQCAIMTRLLSDV
ncbi:hypothetical protein FB567DRAFT_588549 [Paraphoma chrysanthemicola]|uniref:Uncharacterized protein n=1 Tax=Paraphoma chrysanthemicola TaxID=798071 RepID=A0A8K0RDF7_9PLEO|nr:hypothetical protein FB567DRAFT_588549 [Paraphoma chrysanthemicola]